MRKLTSLAAAAILALAVVTPASAAPPERGEDFYWVIFPDLDNGLVVFWNMTRDAYCDWEASDFDGDPPVDHLISFMAVAQPTGAIKVTVGGTAPLELWALDEDAELTGPCEDTDDSDAPWATGSAAWHGTDNDLNHDQSVENGLMRTNAFGDGSHGTVEDGDGQLWKYGWTYRAVFDNDLEFREVVPNRTVLARRG